MRIVLFFLFSLSCATMLGLPSSPGDTNKLIGVHHEWGKLKEVIVGIGDDLSYPGYNEAVSFFYEPEHIEGMKLYGGIDASEIDAEGVKETKAQIDNLARVLDSLGIIVHRSHRLAPEEMQYLEYIQKGSVFLYARDLILVIDTNVIETAISLPFGEKVRYALRPILLERLPGSNAKYVAMPAPSPVFNRDQIFLEGGDVLLNGYDIYVGISGNASTPEGAAWLQQYLGPEYRVHLVKMTPEFQHLDCVLSLVRPGLGIRCPDAFAGELPESIRDWEFIDVSREEAKRLAVNVMILDDKTVIIDKQHHRIGEELKKRGENVIEIPYDKVASWGGAFRCSHHPLVRESKID
ncbi:MAG: hypothetical protein JXA23_11335 [Bacteroidales bacterium]|nr:hypothetical protein [Bacteroidales bacterium]